MGDVGLKSENKSVKEWWPFTYAWFQLDMSILSPLTFPFKTVEVITLEMSFRFTY